MADWPELEMGDEWILSKRGDKNPLDISKPYAIHQEPELAFNGRIEETGTIFLTNRECPFRCLMCDLWKNTTDIKVPSGAIPDQIEWALSKFSGVQHVKLYNSGNFFDSQAIPKSDHGKIASLLSGYQSLIIENHPRLINESALKFQETLKTDLEIAIGLETVHPQVLDRLNKRMTLNDFEKSVRFLSDHSVRTRAFILLRPPFLSEDEGVIWAKKSLDFAFDCGVECAVVIPTRPGNGATDWLWTNGYFSTPSIYSLEKVLDYGVGQKRGRVFADIWDLELFSACGICLAERKERLVRMNHMQKVLPEIECSCIHKGE